MRRLGLAILAFQIAVFASACGRVAGDDSLPHAKCGEPIRDPDVLAPEIARPRPELRFWHTDPALGGCLARVSDHAATRADPTLQTALGRQAFSPDGALVLSSSGLVLNATDFAPIARVPESPAVWAPESGHVAYFSEDNRLYRFDVDRESHELVDTFPEYATLDSRAGLREPSNDGRSMALVGVRASDGVYEVFVWDFMRHEKSPPLAGPIDVVERATGPIWASVSASGNWVLVGWPEPGETRFHGIELYDAHMQFQAHASSGAGAADLALDSRGDEWLVEWSPAENGPGLRKSLLSAGGVTSSELIRLDAFTNVSLSCRAPGSDVCAVATHGNLNGPWQPFQDEIFIADLGGSVERLAHHESAPEFVASQPVADCELSPDAVLPNPALSRDARSVLFTSNWNAHCYGELYLAVR